MNCREGIYMTLKKLVELTDKSDIINECVQLYPECLPHKVDLEKLIDFINETPAFNFTDFEIHVALMDTSDDEDYDQGIDEEPYLVVSGYDSEEDQYLSISYARWEEWANAELLIEKDIHITNEVLISVCLYEMTFYGYDQETIAREFIALESGMTTEVFH